MKEWIVIHKIKAMYDEGKGLSMRAIARELGISRNTVRKYLSMGEEVIEARKSQGERSKVLDQHREYIIHLLQSYPGLSAVKIRDKLLRKHPELSVSSRTVRRYVRRVKESISVRIELIAVNLIRPNYSLKFSFVRGFFGMNTGLAEVGSGNAQQFCPPELTKAVN